MCSMRLGIADHLGWAVAVSASTDGTVVDRRRIELVDPGLPAAPVHHKGGPHVMHHGGRPFGDDELAALVTMVRASAVRVGVASLDELATSLPEPITSMSLRAWPEGFPADIATQRRVPYEAQADAIMYRQVLAELGRARGWWIDRYDAKTVEAEATRRLGERADEVLRRPREILGPPWSKDHRTALAATIMAG
jgi:hypothetical protein